MLGRVAVAYGDGTICECVEVDDDALRGTDFVLAAIALANISIVIELARVFLAEFGIDFLGASDKLWFIFEERENGVFDWGEILVKLQNGAVVAVFVLLYCVSIAQNGEEEPAKPHGGFENPGDVFFARIRIGIM